MQKGMPIVELRKKGDGKISGFYRTLLRMRIDPFRVFPGAWYVNELMIFY
jgi:hypothetical protein